MIRIKDAAKCSGCMTCMMVCPQGAIAKAEGPGGAIYPVVDKGKCVDCGRCERVCPFLSGYLKTKPHGCIVGFTKEENIRSLCTAGGIFAALAASILAQSGAVYGAAYGQGFVCSHICVEEVGDLPKILGKKYAESQAAELFMNLKERLLNDQKVLFSGTPCQIAALRNYLGGTHRNLLCVQVNCSGVVTSGVWQAYLAYEGTPERIELVNRIQGENKAGIRFVYDEEKQRCEVRSETAIHKMIKMGLGLRPACADCLFEKTGSADITLARYNPALERSNEGNEIDAQRQPLGLALYHTPAGRQALEGVFDLLQYRPVTVKEAQKHLKKAHREKPRAEDSLKFIRLLESDGLAEALEKYTQPTAFGNFIKSLRKIIFR